MDRPAFDPIFATVKERADSGIISEGVRGGPGGPWPPQYLALPRLESSEKATTLANLASKPPFQNETRFEGKISRRGEAKQSKF